MLTQQLAGARVEEADVDVVPLHVDAAADPAGRRRVVGRGDFDATVEMHGAAAVLVVAERLERQRAERGAFFLEHGGDPALGRAVNARIGPALLPAVQIRLTVVEALEAESAQRRLLGVADSGFDLALAIGVADPTRQGDDPVVGQHVAVERIERRVVDVRGEDALLEVVEHDDAHGASQPSERPLVQLGPDLRARPLDQQPHGLARVAQGQDEEPCSPVLAGVRVTDHRSLAVVDLCFFAPVRGDHCPGLDGGLLPDGRDETPHACIARGEAVVVDQVLPDGHGVAPAAERVDDQLAVGRARARLRRPTGPLLGDGCGAAAPLPAVVASEESVDTSGEMAGFAGRAGGRPRPRTFRPAAFR